MDDQLGFVKRLSTRSASGAWRGRGAVRAGCRGGAGEFGRRSGGGFTLVELLVVIGIVGVMAGILLPTLSAAREAGKKAVCASNLRQLVVAARMYGEENGGFLPPAHLNFITANLSRWHGTRSSVEGAFEFGTSPMRKQLQTPAIRSCPSFVFAEIASGQGGAFEAACGGYGYNAAYLGSSSGIKAVASGSLPIAEYERRVTNVPARLTQVRRPGETVAFGDTAMAVPALIEYSFIEPPTDSDGNVVTSPSVHFRHRKVANIAWLDGHVSAERLSFTSTRNVYRARNAMFNLGHFGPRDNRLFDRQ